jgi:hypothetical protein
MGDGKKRSKWKRDRTWLEWLGLALRWAGAVVVIGLLYLLSFGPVERYCAKVITKTKTPTAYNADGQIKANVTVTTVRYPGWVGIVYRPAFMLRAGSGGDGLYGRYLLWWDNLGSANGN